MDRSPSPELPTSRWVSIRRPPTAMTTVSGGFAGGGWEYVESPSPSPSPPISPPPTCRPERWGVLHRDRFPSYDLEPNRSAAETRSSNPLPMWALLACLRTAENAPTESLVSCRRATREQDAGGRSTTDRSDKGDRLIEAWLEAQEDVKKQMRKMGLDVSSSSDDD